MDLKMIKNIYELHVKGFEGLDFEIIRKENYEIAYSKHIKDTYSNFISNFDIKNAEEFESIMNDADKTFREINRKNSIYLIPYMEEVYSNRKKYFNNNEFELLSTEVWQVYNDFNNLDYIKTDCNFDVELEQTNNMEEYANIMMERISIWR